MGQSATVAYSNRLCRRLLRLAGSAAFAVVLAAVPWDDVRAEDSREVWPELNGFIRLDDRTRIHLVTAYARGKESPSHTLDVAGYVDVSLVPYLRPVLRQEDWARNRYLWTRVGYTHVLKSEGGAPTPPEHRGVLSVYGKAPFPGQIWVECRARADLRWISGVYSTRYRLRAEATREFTVLHRPVTPYANFEVLYDTRYDDWSRTLAMGGAEITFHKHFRFEAYLARQTDEQPGYSALNALGLLAKLYF